MNYEKKYKEALERANNIRKDAVEMENTITTKTCEVIFPELKESEDERIRTGLINGFKECLKKSNYPKSTQKYWHNIKIEDILAWLEKQGEQNLIMANSPQLGEQKPFDYEDANIQQKDFAPKSAMEAAKEKKIDNANKVEPKDYSNIDPHFFKTTDKVEPKFKVGDFIVNDYCSGKVIKITDDAYLLDTGQGIPFSCEHNAHLWNVTKDAKDGDVLATDKSVFIYAEVLYNKPYAYCGVDKFGVFKDNCREHDWTNSVDNIHPATKEQRDLLFQKMQEAGYEWDVEKKELKKIKFNPDELIEESYQQQADDLIDMVTEKSAWSDEDERNIQNIDAVLFYDRKLPEDTCVKLRNFLKTLKQRIGGESYER